MMAEQPGLPSSSPLPDPDPDALEASSSRSASPTPPPQFNFNQPAPAHNPEEAFFKNFNAAEHHATQRSAREIGIFLTSRRRATAQAALQHGLGMSSAYIDQDQSGNYDPSPKRAPRPPTRKRKKKAPELDQDGIPKPKLAKPHKNRVGYRTLITFKFTKKAGLDYLRSITPDPIDKPVLWSENEHSDSDDDSDSDGDSESSEEEPDRRKKRKTKRPERLGVTTRDDGMTLDDITIGHPQHRGCKACFLSGNDDCSLVDDPFEYPCEACEDAECDCEFIIPPEFKDVCSHCKFHKLECSFEIDGGENQDKCQGCAEDDIPCCAGPVEENSFTRRYDQVLSRNTPEREELAAKRKVTPPPPVRDRRFVSCNQCRDQGLRCNLKGKATTGPCRPCKKAGQECKFVWAPIQTELPPKLLELAPNLSFKVKNKYGKNRSSTPDRFTSSFESGESLSPNTNTKVLYGEMDRKLARKLHRLEKKQALLPSKGKHTPYQSKKHRREQEFMEENPILIGSTLGIRHIHITTSFCHPIKFNYIPPPDFSPITMPSARKKTGNPTVIHPPEDPCNFCDNKFFGLTGLCDEAGPRTVEGFYYPDGSGFEEVSGGYSDLGHAATKMCVPCTTARIQIMGCPAHRIRPLHRGTEIDDRIFDDAEWDKAISALKNGDIEGGKVVTEAKWCSICATAASSKCCATQEDGDPGCGLLLCEKCDGLMEQIYKGGIRTNPEVISAHIREMGVQSYRFPAPRADASFLTAGGELMVRLQQGMGQKPIVAASAEGATLSGKEKERARRKKASQRWEEDDDADMGREIAEIRRRNRGGKSFSGSSIAAGERSGSGSRRKTVDKNWENIVEEEQNVEEVVRKKRKKYGKRAARPDGEIEFGGALSEEARAEQDRRVEMAFGFHGLKASIVDLTGDD